MTSGTADELTLKAPYPVCQPKSACVGKVARIHFELLVFTMRIISATEAAGEVSMSKCTWSATPPMARACASFRSRIPRIYESSRSRMVSLMNARLPFVEKMQW